MNIFEGARRIATVGAVLGIIGVVYSAATYKPYIEQRFAIAPSGDLTEVDKCTGSELRAHVPFDNAYVTAIVCGIKEGPSELELAPAELEQIKKKVSSEKLSSALETVGYTVLWLFLYWCSVWIVGWIVRGFFGIPTGQDHRAKQSVV